MSSGVEGNQVHLLKSAVLHVMQTTFKMLKENFNLHVPMSERQLETKSVEIGPVFTA